ncbi:MAG: hypothetical protein B6226_00235 [Candidatus Cloacimonetes bacterium 4572_65]|nr:MAG: hypothetical protein B6226_00235 [Candidatus Cloacimonetes bacterium 4572_65]
MKKSGYFGIGCLTSLLLFVLVVFGSFYAVTKVAGGSVEKIGEKNILAIDLKGNVPEYSRLKNDRYIIDQTSVIDIITAIKQAKNDDRIYGLLLKPEMFICGYASMNEIIDALEDFKTSGKTIKAFVTIASNNDMLIASCADEVVISASSSAGVFLKGFGVDVTFYKNMFAKFGIKMNVISAGKYKDYGTQYTHDKITPEMKSNYNRILKSRYEQFVNQISQQLDISALTIESVVNNEDFMILNSRESLKVGFVDKIQYEIDFLKDIEGIFDTVLTSKKYLLAFNNKDNKNLYKKVAVLYLSGKIMPLQSDYSVLSANWVESAVEDILDDRTIKACVVRVNSPGGSAFESEKILKALTRLKAKMPVVISMGDYAASGGYMISCVGDVIVADPYTITGSIGVVQLIPELKELQSRLGIDHDKLEYGKKSTWLNPLNGLSQPQIEAYRNSANNVYDSFKKIVLKGRSEKFTSLEEVEAVAQGQVWDSISAKENGLIDEIGSLNDAIKIAVGKSTIKESFERVNYPKRRDFFELLLADKLGISEMKTLLFKGVSDDIYQQKVMFETLEKNSTQTLLPADFN